MTQLSKYHELVSQLDEHNVVAIIGLIDLKTEDDMDKVLNKLDTMTEKFEAKFDAMDQKFDAMDQKFDAKLDAMDQKFDAKFDALDYKISTIKWWLVSVVTLAVGVALTIVRLL